MEYEYYEPFQNIVYKKISRWHIYIIHNDWSEIQILLVFLPQFTVKVLTNLPGTK